MTDNRFQAAVRKSAGSLWLPKSRISWEKIIEPKVKKDKKTGKDITIYELTVMVPTKADLKAMFAYVDVILNENVPAAKRKTTKFKIPYKKTADNPKMADYADEFEYTVSATTNVPPGVVGPDGKTKITDSSEAYSGRWCVPSVGGKYYDFVEEENNSRITGVKFYLNNVMLLDHDDPIGGFKRASAEDEFGDAGVSTAESIFD